jgi:hypothetical protein
MLSADGIFIIVATVSEQDGSSVVAPEVLAVREMKDEPPAAPAVPESTLGSAASMGLVEIVLGNGHVLRVAERIDPAVLARLAAALDRR